MEKKLLDMVGKEKYRIYSSMREGKTLINIDYIYKVLEHIEKELIRDIKKNKSTKDEKSNSQNPLMDERVEVKVPTINVMYGNIMKPDGDFQVRNVFFYKSVKRAVNEKERLDRLRLEHLEGDDSLSKETKTIVRTILKRQLKENKWIFGDFESEDKKES